MITVSVTSITAGEYTMPGDFDPLFARMVSVILRGIANSRSDVDPLSYTTLIDNANYFKAKAVLMVNRAWLGPWWKTDW